MIIIRKGSKMSSHPSQPQHSTSQCSFCIKLLQLVATASLLAPSPGADCRSVSLLPAEWHQWKAEHGRGYRSEWEELYRHVIWQSNKKLIDVHNRFNQTFGYTLAMNELGDLTEEEYHMQYSCVKYSSAELQGAGPKVPLYSPPLNVTLPNSVDWHTKGAVSSVTNQGNCCSSYAFSAVGAIEGALALAEGILIPLSVQNIVDCSSPYGNHGCSKGQMERAFEYAIDMGGVDTEESYPYDGSLKKCRFKKYSVEGALRSYQRIKAGDEDDLQSAVALAGPISMAADVQHNTFRFYQRGVYDEPNCSTHKLTHAMLIVGYGTYYNKDFWLVKNSWGRGWGMNGYVMMARNKNNQCGIASRAYFPML